MNRFFSLIMSGVLLIIMTSFMDTDVMIRMEMPDTIEAGTEITVNATIRKGKLNGFARFQQELPYGFTAIAVNSANADFSFQDQKVRLIWLRLPDDDEITISYKIIADERLTGTINLDGRFSYIESNERKSVDIQPQMLAINASPNVDPLLLVDVKDYAKIASRESSAALASRVVSLRQQPVWVKEQNVFLVTLLINKEALEKFAKIEETVPSGYTAASVDSKGGIFTFKDHIAKFIWMDLPSDSYFTVTYKLIPEEGFAVNQSDMNISGFFSYMVGDKTMTTKTVERPEMLAGLDQNQVNKILKGVLPDQPVLVASVNETSPTQVASNQSKPSAPSSGKVGKNESEILKPESGIYYRVQIAAGHRSINAQRYFRKYKLDYSVMKEEHDGWFKYSVGSFGAYKDARDYRVHLGNTTSLHDAFIAAYNNGSRITVQEALMALNQRWYK